MATFYYDGHETVGNFVRAQLEAADHFEVSDPACADVIFSYFTTASEVENAYLDSEGFIQIAQQDALLVDLSPLAPSFARELSALAQVSGLQFVEAPLAVRSITVADAFALPGNVECCMAGIDDARTRALPFLETIFSCVHDCGASGQAQLAHAAYAIQLASLIAANAEAHTLFAFAGARSYDAFSADCSCANHEVRKDSRESRETQQASSACAPALTDLSGTMLEAMVEHRFEGSYTCEMLMGDIDAALYAAQDDQITLPLADVCMNLLELLAVVGGSDMSPVALALDYTTEEEAAQYGLDWNRAKEVSAEHEDDYDDYDDYDDDYYDDCGCGHDHRAHHDDCGCGHEHHNHHDDCGCGHERHESC